MVITRGDEGWHERAWIASVDAVNIVTGKRGDVQVPKINPAAAGAVLALDIRINHSMWHPLDEDAVKQALTILRDAGCLPEPDDLAVFARCNGFWMDSAAKLRNLAEQAGGGRRFRSRHGRRWRDDVLGYWINRACKDACAKLRFRSSQPSRNLVSVGACCTATTRRSLPAQGCPMAVRHRMSPRPLSLAGYGNCRGVNTLDQREDNGGAHPVLEHLRPILAERILGLRDEKGEFGNVLQTAQAVSALHGIGGLGSIDAKREVERLMGSQREDGSWPELLAFGDQSLKWGAIGQIGHGSESVTSAYCIEALECLVRSLGA